MSLQTRTRRSVKAASITLEFMWRPTAGPSSLPVQQLSCSLSSVPLGLKALLAQEAPPADRQATQARLVELVQQDSQALQALRELRESQGRLGTQAQRAQQAALDLREVLVQRERRVPVEAPDPKELKAAQDLKEAPDQLDPKVSRDYKETKEPLVQPDILELQELKEVKVSLVELDQQAAVDRLAVRVLRDRVDLLARAVQLGLQVQLQDRQAVRGSPVPPVQSRDQLARQAIRDRWGLGPQATQERLDRLARGPPARRE